MLLWVWGPGLQAQLPMNDSPTSGFVVVVGVVVVVVVVVVVITKMVIVRKIIVTVVIIENSNGNSNTSNSTYQYYAVTVKVTAAVTQAAAPASVVFHLPSVDARETNTRVWCTGLFDVVRLSAMLRSQRRNFGMDIYHAITSPTPQTFWPFQYANM